MQVENSTVKTQFFLLGFSDHPKLQSALFAVFLSIYSVTLMGNLRMILLITISPHLHTPIYFFLHILSFIDACYSSVIAPKLLVDLISDKKTISYNGCAAQFYFFCCLVDTEPFLFTVMAYDQYIAICNPLLYTVIMSKRICWQLAIGAFLGGTMSSVIHTTNTERLLLNEKRWPSFLGSGGEEFNLGPKTRLDSSELLCNKVLLKYKGDRESF